MWSGTALDGPKLFLGDYLESVEHAKFCFGLPFAVPDITIFFIKVSDFGPFSEGWQGTLKLPDPAHI